MRIFFESDCLGSSTVLLLHCLSGVSLVLHIPCTFTSQTIRCIYTYNKEMLNRQCNTEHLHLYLYTHVLVLVLCTPFFFPLLYNVCLLASNYASKLQVVNHVHNVHVHVHVCTCVDFIAHRYCAIYMYVYMYMHVNITCVLHIHVHTIPPYV